MASPEIEKLLQDYASGNKVEASNKLAKLTGSGNSEAQFYLARIFSQNGLRFLASDSWVDLLNQDAQPREVVSRSYYETLTWLGNTTEARKFLMEENLFELQNDLDKLELVRDEVELRQKLGELAVALQKNQDDNSSSLVERQLNELELSARLGYIASQIGFCGSSFQIGTSLFTSGGDVFEIDFDSYIYPPDEYWPTLLLKSAQILRDAINLEHPDWGFVSALAAFAQDIQERIFFMNGSISAITDNEKSALSFIALGLSSTRPVASNFYLSILAD